MDGGRVEVFEHDIYTVVPAERAAEIVCELERVPVRGRPAVSRELLAFYADCFPPRPSLVLEGLLFRRPDGASGATSRGAFQRVG